LGVAALLEPEEHAALVVADELLELLELQLSGAVESDHLAHQLIRFGEIPNDLDQPLIRDSHRRPL
jgi:hypothetical protein